MTIIRRLEKFYRPFLKKKTARSQSLLPLIEGKIGVSEPKTLIHDFNSNLEGVKRGRIN